MKIYKVNWEIKAYMHEVGGSSKHVANFATYKFTTDKDKAQQIIKELEKCAAYLGIAKELKTWLTEEECDG